MLIRAILAKWAETPQSRRVYEGDFSPEEIADLNARFYSIYFLPNGTSQWQKGRTVDGSQIDEFNYVFVDMDLKDGRHTKESFIDLVKSSGIEPTSIIDSGRGIHVYWEISDLDAMSYLRLQRRLCRKFNTDPAVGQIYQLMRLPNTVNPKDKDDFKLCQQLYGTATIYTCEELDKLLPTIAQEDEDYCQVHFAKTYKLDEQKLEIDDKLPVKFAKLLRVSQEVKSIWAGDVDDRSKGDFRLGHILFASGFKREEALSVLVNTSKALARAPVHRVSYAENIVDKIWTFENSNDKEGLDLSSSVKSILEKAGDQIKGTRFPCWSYIDNTEHGFRLGQVIGLVAGSGVGKTAMALNLFQGFVQQNPDYTHFFIPLEQPAVEIADRWRTMCGNDTRLHDKVQVLSNYDDGGGYRNLSFSDIKEYLAKWQKLTGKKIGCVVIDHIGALKKSNTDGRQSVEDICHEMKAFAVELNVLLVMQSQTPREKAGIGDLELSKDAAYGTVFFESYCDYLLVLWQPLKRCYDNPACPTVTAFKFCKIRHKRQGVDLIKEDVCYRLLFDSINEKLRELTQDEETAFDFYQKQASNRRKKAAQRDQIAPYVSAKWATEEGSKDERKISNDPDSQSA